MSVMIRHTVSEPKKSFWKVMILIFIIAILINISIELTNYLPSKLAMFISIGVVILSVVICFYIINRKIAKYMYIIINGTLTINRQIGNKEQTLLYIKIKDIECIRPMEFIKEEGNCDKTLRLCCKLRGIELYFAQYRENGKLHRFIFQPDQRIYNEILRQINEN